MDVKANLWMWKKKMKLTQPEFKYLAEAYRRAHQFHNGDYSYMMLVPEAPSAMKTAIKNGYFIVVGKEIPRIVNWYSLTPKGIQLLKTLEPLIEEWNDEKNWIFYNGTGWVS